jgi:cytochrome c-type biogenesis protein CcmF
VLWGTLFPVLTEAVQGTKISVGAPFFNKVNIPIGLLLLLLTGLGPLFAWRKTSVASLKRNFLVPSLLAVATGVALAIAGVREFYPLVSLMLCAFVTVTILMEFIRGAHVIAQKSGVAFLQACYTLTMRNTRRYGGYIVHFGMVLIFLGITGTAFNTEREQELSLGDRLALGPYEFELKQVVDADNPNYASQHVELAMYRGGEMVDTLRPERRFYKTSKQATTEASIRPRMNEDLYIIFSGVNEQNQKAVVAVHRNPLVNWIWLGGLVLIFGTGVCLVPSKPGLVAVQRKPSGPASNVHEDSSAAAA